ncbi:hypothetical protein AAMO2058_000567500 [Amorphochlora amoebiformis]
MYINNTTLRRCQKLTQNPEPTKMTYSGIVIACHIYLTRTIRPPPGSLFLAHPLPSLSFSIQSNDSSFGRYPPSTFQENNSGTCRKTLRHIPVSRLQFSFFKIALISGDLPSLDNRTSRQNLKSGNA